MPVSEQSRPLSCWLSSCRKNWLRPRHDVNFSHCYFNSLWRMGVIADTLGSQQVNPRWRACLHGTDLLSFWQHGGLIFSTVVFNLPSFCLRKVDFLELMSWRKEKTLLVFPTGTRRCWSQHHLHLRLNKIKSVKREHRRKCRRESKGKFHTWARKMCKVDTMQTNDDWEQRDAQLPFKSIQQINWSLLVSYQWQCPFNGNLNPDTKGKLPLKEGWTST